MDRFTMGTVSVDRLDPAKAQSTVFHNNLHKRASPHSNTGHTIVWDLHTKHEAVALTYGGAGQASIIGGGGKKGMSGVAWYPGNASFVVSSRCGSIAVALVRDG